MKKIIAYHEQIIRYSQNKLYELMEQIHVHIEQIICTHRTTIYTYKKKYMNSQK